MCFYFYVNNFLFFSSESVLRVVLCKYIYIYRYIRFFLFICFQESVKRDEAPRNGRMSVLQRGKQVQEIADNFC